MSEQTELQAQEEQEKGRNSLLMSVLEIAARAGIILAVLAFISENEYRHIERTERSFQSLAQRRQQSDMAAMALGYLNKEINYPFCPFNSFCKVRPRHSFENLEFYNARRDEGIRLEKDNLETDALEKANFKSSNLRKISMSEISLRRTTFRDTQLQNAQILDVDLTCAKFLNSDLTGATIYYKNLSGAEFIGTNISKLTLIDEDGGPQALDLSQDKGQRYENLEKRGLMPHTFAGAWAWKGEEPQLPLAYQTFEVCDKPVNTNLPAATGQTGQTGGQTQTDLAARPQNCVARTRVTSIPQNVCQQLEANGGAGQAFVNWVDRQILWLIGK